MDGQTYAHGKAIRSIFPNYPVAKAPKNYQQRGRMIFTLGSLYISKRYKSQNEKGSGNTVEFQPDYRLFWRLSRCFSVSPDERRDNNFRQVTTLTIRRSSTHHVWIVSSSWPLQLRQCRYITPGPTNLKINVMQTASLRVPLYGCTNLFLSGRWT
jgi:hypothetical protein